MGAVTFSLDPTLLTVLLSHVSFSSFIETGTFRGDTVSVVLGRVPSIISIESDALIAAEASARFAHDPSVHIVSASGAEALSDLASSLKDEDVLYWLDAHWSVMPEGDGPAKRECELLAEIAAIGHLSANSVVLIDDARYFLCAPPAPHDPAQWPTLASVLGALTKVSPTHEVTVVNDVIAFFPPTLAEAMNEFAVQHGVDWLNLADRARGYDGLLADNMAKEEVITELNRSIAAVELPDLWSELTALSLPRAARSKAPRVAPGAAVRRAQGFARSKISRPFALEQYEPVPPGLTLLRKSTLSGWPADLPGLAIAMPSLNQARFIELSIRSVISQRYPNIQFVIQDGGSIDDSVPVIETFRRHLHGFASEPDNGQADAINRAFAQTDAEIMGWLNSDDLLMPGALAVVGNYFAQHPDVDVIYGSRLVIDEAGLEIGRWVVPPTTHVFLEWADYIPQETLYWRRSLWERVGGQLDTSLLFAMDWDLLLRFADAGATFACLPEVLGAFRVHGHSKTVGLIESLGSAEMDEIRKKRHGRPVTSREINAALTPLYLRSWQSRLLQRR